MNSSTWLRRGVSWACLLAVALLSSINIRAEPLRVLSAGELPEDVRLGPLKDLNGYFPFVVPPTREAWAQRTAKVRRQILVSLGLWPMPARTPLNPVIHGRLEQDGYTVEKVYFESVPGFFVTGSLYRPTGHSGRVPGVLCPHGHWSNGRFMDAGEAEARKQIAQGAERFMSGARSPLQARCVQLARMGCVVFHFDMIGYADSQQITEALAHRFSKQRPEMSDPAAWGLFSAPAESRFQSVMGLQTWNAIRSLDFLLGLPDVDPERVAVTGASGGGTQSFILGAIEDRLAGSFPAVMVSTAMQGGCTCENAANLRINTGNVEFAALAAPKPQGLTCANDWTVEMATKGFPELKGLYELLGAGNRVELNRGEHFGHNYNHVSRTAMYGWMNRLFKLGFTEPVLESDFERLTGAALTVWDAEHPRPEGGPEFERRLLAGLAQDVDRSLRATWSDPAAFRKVHGEGLEIVVGRTLAEVGEVEWQPAGRRSVEGGTLRWGRVRNATHREELPAVWLEPEADAPAKPAVLWLTARGKGGLFGSDGTSPRPAVRRLLAAGHAVLSADLFEQGEFRPDGEPLTQTRRVDNPRESAAYTQGYNYSVMAQRAQDVLTLVQLLRREHRTVLLVGLEGAGAIAAAAGSVAGDAIEAAAIDTEGFRFGQVRDVRSPQFLPGGARYGDLPGMLAAAQFQRLALAGEGDEVPPVLQTVAPAGGVQLLNAEGAPVARQVLRWILAR
ncbi:MAG: acetylxylan esterase [Verrucomicrobiales bacterium]|nr:acetylxylan esterase [Verrucomicrobiales bacterium]MCP5528137.1 acetylxylan esterase [Verrucomicrobiales bacterium]